MEVAKFKTCGIVKDTGYDEKLIIIEKNVPMELDEHDVLIKVKACALPNYEDILSASLISEPTETVPLGADIAGIVERIGAGVTNVAIGDHVTGIIPQSRGRSGCAEYITVNEFDAVKIPDSLSFIKVAATIGDGVRAYIGLFQMGNLKAGNKVLILNGAMACPALCLQLAHQAGAKVFTTCNTADEERYLKTLQYCIDHIIHVNNENPIRGELSDECMSLTDQLGVDLVIDISRDYDEEEDNDEIISCLTCGGRWVTTNSDLQLDPPDSLSLFERSVSVSFLNDQAFITSCIQKGKHQHMLLDICYKLEKGMLTACIHHTVEFDQLTEVFNVLADCKVGKIVLTLP